MGLEIKFPYADREIVNFGLALPIEHKLSSDKESPRKLLLRSLGKKIGLPDEVAFRPKKAIQYSTGVDRILRQLARKQGLKLSRFLAEKFYPLKETYPEFTEVI
jgi:asparagine synthase (glutamine-hydrolysing)